MSVKRNSVDTFLLSFETNETSFMMYRMTPSMMYTIGFLPGLHVLGMIIFLSGIVLLLAWAIKHWSAADQKKWGTALVLVDAILCLLSFVGFARGMGDGRYGGNPLMQGWNIPYGGMMQGR